jgi:hydrocephalus-inducing protein
VEWRPLLSRASTSRLTLTSPQLGSYIYELKLYTLPSGEQKVLHYKVALGDAQTLKFRFKNFLRKAETYTLKLGGGSDYQVAATVAAPAATDMQGAEVSVDVTFEPSKLGASAATLTASSAEGGEHVCALHGQTLPPKPQGPIAVKAGGSAQISFKNVFDGATDFSIACEPAAFSVAKTKETVPGKKPLAIAVAYKPDAKGGAPAKGKLTISTGGESPCLWVYYLSGE